MGTKNRADAERFLREFRERLVRFGLELHPDKTRLIEFGRFAARNRKQRGEGKPETFTYADCGGAFWSVVVNARRCDGTVSPLCRTDGFPGPEFWILIPTNAPPSSVRAVCVNAHVRICAGGDQRWSSLPRQLFTVVYISAGALIECGRFL
jgi:hypothetical protein